MRSAVLTLLFTLAPIVLFARENDPKIDMKKAKQTLDEMGWSGWLVLERSRDASRSRDVKYNFSANAKYVKSVFQS